MQYGYRPEEILYSLRGRKGHGRTSLDDVALGKGNASKGQDASSQQPQGVPWLRVRETFQAHLKRKAYEHQHHQATDNNQQ